MYTYEVQVHLIGEQLTDFAFMNSNFSLAEKLICLNRIEPLGAERVFFGCGVSESLHCLFVFSWGYYSVPALKFYD